MVRQADIIQRLSTVFNQPQSCMLAEVLTEAYSDLVKTGDFNLFGRRQCVGKNVLLDGGIKLRLGEPGYISAFAQLAAKAEVVKTEYPDADIALMLIPYFARPGVLESARERGVIVGQSFGW